MAEGDDAWWAAAIFVGIPNAVTNLRVTARSATSLTWEFGAPSGGGPITRYEYRSQFANGSFSGAWTSTGTTRRIVLSGLTRNTAYKIQVRAAGPAGNGPIEEDEDSTGALTPRKPTNFSVTAAGQAFRLQARVDNGGSAITKWQRRGASSSGGVATASWTDIPNSAADTVDWTSGDFGYTTQRFFQVRAVSALGEGVSSDIEDATTGARPLAAPGPPRNLSSTVTGSTIRWSWDAPNTGGAVARYEYRISATGTFAGAWQDNSTSRTFSLTGLSQGATRHIQVRAVNATDNSTAVADSATTRTDVVTTDTDHIWALDTTAPTAPAGGTNTENHAPTGWQRTEPGPTETQNVYRASRTRTFTNGTFTSATTWGSVVKVADATGTTATAPSKPTGFTVTPSMNTVRLRATVNNGGSAITKWQYRNAAVNFVGIATWQDVPNSDTVSLDFTLTVGYSDTSEYQVRAVNAVDTGPQSDTVTATTPAEPVTSTAPAKPTNFRATVSTNQVRLRASVDNGGSAITKWQYRSASSEAGLASATWTDLPTSASDTLDETVTQTYSRRVFYDVRAVNDIGNGDPSDAVSATTGARPITRPGAVTNLTATPDGTELDVSYGAPDSGSAVVRYEYRSQRTSRAWDSGFAVPAGASIPTGLAVDTNGDILVLDNRNNRIYRHNGTSWDSGLAVPAGVGNLRGLAVAANRDILMVNNPSSNISTARIYRHNGTSWDRGFAVPTGVHPAGLAVDTNGDILVLDDNNDRIYRHNGTSWDSGFTVPTAAVSPTGLAVAANRDILMVNTTNDRIYRYNGTAWDSGFAVPTAATGPHGVAVAPNGDILIVDLDTDRIYRYAAGAQSSWISNGTNRTFTLTSLTHGANYKIDVRAWNTAGYGPEASVEQEIIN